MPRRGNSTQRGYGYSFQQQRKQAKAEVDAGLVNCWRCGQWIHPDDPWDLGHDDYDRTIIRGPECRHCNRSAAAIKGNRMRGQGSGTPSDAWQ